jgi:hypothetical protein
MHGAGVIGRGRGKKSGERTSLHYFVVESAVT